MTAIITLISILRVVSLAARCAARGEITLPDCSALGAESFQINPDGTRVALKGKRLQAAWGQLLLDEERWESGRVAGLRGSNEFRADGGLVGEGAIGSTQWADWRADAAGLRGLDDQPALCGTGVEDFVGLDDSPALLERGEWLPDGSYKPALYESGRSAHLRDSHLAEMRSIARAESEQVRGCSPHHAALAAAKRDRLARYARLLVWALDSHPVVARKAAGEVEARRKRALAASLGFSEYPTGKWDGVEVVGGSLRRTYTAPDGTVVTRSVDMTEVPLTKRQALEVEVALAFQAGDSGRLERLEAALAKLPE